MAQEFKLRDSDRAKVENEISSLQNLETGVDNWYTNC